LKGLNYQNLRKNIEKYLMLKDDEIIFFDEMIFLKIQEFINSLLIYKK
jgi:hypothetical protein